MRVALITSYPFVARNGNAHTAAGYARRVHASISVIAAAHPEQRPASQIVVLQAGMAQKARQLEAELPNWRWLGPLGQGATRRHIARSHLGVISSWMEGDAAFHAHLGDQCARRAGLFEPAREAAAVQVLLP
jgi:hypothetical protein